MPKEDLKFEIKMVDIKLKSNVPNSKEFSLTSDMFDFNEKVTLMKYPLLSKDILLPINKLKNLDYNTRVKFFFNTKIFRQIINKHVKVSQTENERQKTYNLEMNTLYLLKLLLPTKFPVSDNVYSSFDKLNNNKSKYSDLVPSAYTFLKLNNEYYTVTQVIWLTDFLNNTYYLNIVNRMSSYIEWCQNIRSVILDDVNDKYKRLTEYIKIYSSRTLSRDIALIDSKISNSTNRADSSRTKYETIKDYIDSLGNDGELKKLRSIYAVKFRTHPDFHYICKYDYSTQSQVNLLGFHNKYIPIEPIKSDFVSIDRVDWTKSKIQLSIHRKGDALAYSSFDRYLSEYWPSSKVLPQNNYIGEDTGFSVKHENDKFIITANAQLTFASIATPYLQEKRGNIPFSRDEIDGFFIELDENLFYDIVRIKELVLLPDSIDDKEELFSKLQTINSMKNYIPDLSKEFKELMKECDNIEQLMLKYEFYKKMLKCDKEDCIKMDINTNRYSSDFFKPFVEFASVMRNATSKNRRLICNNGLQKQIDDYSTYREPESNFLKDIQNDIIKYLISNPSDLNTLSSDHYKTSICEINFGKQNVPKYETYIHLDLLQGKADDDKISPLQCVFKDERYNEKLKNYLYNTGNKWKIAQLPFYKLDSEKSNKKSSGTQKVNKPSKKMPSQGGSKTRKKY